MTTPRCLVTGCAGFIGSRVCQLLLAAGHKVLGVDDLNEAYDPRLKQWRLDALHPQPGFTFQKLDIADRAALAGVFQACSAGQSSFDAVVNLAARAGVRSSLADPWIYFRTNCEATLTLLELSRQHGVRKFVLASSSSLYGDQNPVPYAEDTDTDRPLSPYAASKKAAEITAHAYHHLYGLDVTVLRYFTVYGPAGRPDMAVFRFIRCIAEGEPIVVFGDGSQKRDFTYVDCIARGTVAAIAPLGYEIINLGGDRPAKVSDVIAEIARLLGRSARIEYRPAHPADIPIAWAEIGKARELLGWSPQVSLEEGLRRSVEWYLENRDFARGLALGGA